MQLTSFIDDKKNLQLQKIDCRDITYLSKYRGQVWKTMNQFQEWVLISIHEKHAVLHSLYALSSWVVIYNLTNIDMMGCLLIDLQEWRAWEQPVAYCKQWFWLFVCCFIFFPFFYCAVAILAFRGMTVVNYKFWIYTYINTLCPEEFLIHVKSTIH